MESSAWRSRSEHPVSPRISEISKLGVKDKPSQSARKTFIQVRTFDNGRCHLLSRLAVLGTTALVVTTVFVRRIPDKS
jgi:hypothetical protein